MSAYFGTQPAGQPDIRRQTLAVRDTVTLRDETVAPFPGVPVDVDVTAFDAAADAAVQARFGLVPGPEAKALREP
jgi:hypothetical protein